MTSPGNRGGGYLFRLCILSETGSAGEGLRDRIIGRNFSLPLDSDTEDNICRLFGPYRSSFRLAGGAAGLPHCLTDMTRCLRYEEALLERYMR